jgi:energy-converting hydrogenase B subunit D
MHAEFELVIYLFLIASAWFALHTRDLLAGVVTLGVYSFMVALLCVVMGAVDVGFTEAVVGAGITGVLFVVALYHTERKSLD